MEQQLAAQLRIEQTRADAYEADALQAEQEMEVEQVKAVDVEMELEQELQQEQETVLDSTAVAAVVLEQRVFLSGSSYTKGLSCT